MIASMSSVRNNYKKDAFEEMGKMIQFEYKPFQQVDYNGPLNEFASKHLIQLSLIACLYSGVVWISIAKIDIIGNKPSLLDISEYLDSFNSNIESEDRTV